MPIAAAKSETSSKHRTLPRQRNVGPPTSQQFPVIGQRFPVLCRGAHACASYQSFRGNFRGTSAKKDRGATGTEQTPRSLLEASLPNPCRGGRRGDPSSVLPGVWDSDLCPSLIIRFSGGFHPEPSGNSGNRRVLASEQVSSADEGRCFSFVSTTKAHPAAGGWRAAWRKMAHRPVTCVRCWSGCSPRIG